MSEILEKKNSPFTAVQITGNDGAFSIWPNITPQKSLFCGVMMGQQTKYTPITTKTYPKRSGNDFYEVPAEFSDFCWN